MEEREVALLESRLRRALATLEELAVPTLAEVRAPRRLPVWRALLAPVGAVAVIAAALVLGAGLAAWRDAATQHAATQPSDVPLTRVDASVASRYLDVAGYRFTVSVVADPAFRSTGADSAAHTSGVDGVGLHCIWDRLGPDLTHVSDLIGTTDDVASVAGHDTVTSGAHTDRLIGIPSAAVKGNTATVVCGASDLYGAHGIVANLGLSGNSAAPVRSLSVSQWSGVVGDAAAVAPCTGKAGGGATLIAAFVSTADAVASWIENAAYPEAPHLMNSVFRTQYAPNAPIYVCYFSGSWNPPVGPAGAGATERPISYDRERLFVDTSGTALYPQTIGPSSQLTLVRPGGRF